MSEHTPDTEEVEHCYVGEGLDAGERSAAFHRWLANHDREAEQRYQDARWNVGYEAGWASAKRHYESLVQKPSGVRIEELSNFLRVPDSVVVNMSPLERRLTEALYLHIKTGGNHEPS